MTTSLTVFIYLVLLINIFLVAAHMTKKRMDVRRLSAEGAENPFVETEDTVEFGVGSEPVNDAEVRVLLPSGYEHKLLLCRGGSVSPEVKVYVAKGMTLIIDSLQTIRETPRTMEPDLEARIQFPDGRVHYVTRCYTGSTEDIDLDAYAAAGITLIAKIWKLVNY